MYTVKSNFAMPRPFSGLFEEIMNNGGFTRGTEDNLHFPPVNIKEDETGYTVNMVAPGLKKEAFKMKLDKNLLHISYEHQDEQKEENSKWLRNEYKFRSFKRTFTLNDKVDMDKISASYNDGILAISLPKKETVAQETKEIAIS